MSFEFSQLGTRLGTGSGIEELMDDLGHALASGGPTSACSAADNRPGSPK
jgi:alanine-alpha-ketoisovalerate/valine-pyruvate aminotransferase